MDKYKQTAVYLVADFLSASLAWLVFNMLRYLEVAMYEGYGSMGAFLVHSQVWKGQLLIPLFWLVVYYFSGYYNKPFGKSRLGEFFLTMISVSAGVVFIFFLVILNDLPRSFEVYYTFFFALLGIQFCFTYLPRLLITAYQIRKVRTRKWLLNVLMIGSGRAAQQTARYLHGMGYRVCGFVPEGPEAIIAVPREQIRGSLDDLPRLMEQEQVHELVLAADADDNSRMLPILYSLCQYSCPVKVLANETNLLWKVAIKTICGIPLIDVTKSNLSDAGQNIKFVSDKLISLLALILLSPLLAYIAYGVKRDSPGPALFRQERIGYRGRPFVMYKFRTMRMDSESCGPLLASEGDQRITPLGKFMRRYRLDELPQFWNVLKGDMSLVGPRPERKFFIDRIVKTAPWYYLLHNVRPGITSLGMVKYGYAGTVEQMVERLKYDILYYENMSLALDITVLVHTVRTVLTGKGV